MDSLWVPIVVPLVAGVIIFLLPRRTKWLAEILALAGTAWALVASAMIFGSGENARAVHWSVEAVKYPFSVDLVVDPLRSFILLFVAVFGFLIVLYSLSSVSGLERRTKYYSFAAGAVGASCGAVLSDNLLVFLIFWEFVSLLFFFLVTLGDEKTSHQAAGKSFVMLGFSDCALLLGVVMFWKLTGGLAMSGAQPLAVEGSLATVAFILFFVGAMTKAGAMPFHTWIPAAATTAPVAVMAFLPAALDKLLGIYLLARMAIPAQWSGGGLFDPGGAMNMLLMIVGAATILCAVMMALVQHDLKRLLSYHAVSQVGYMVLGIGTGTAVGIAGGLFHMLNNAIYKSCLFMGAGAVEKRAGTTEVGELGGLGPLMPVTFLCATVAAMSISGIPPFNGFVSKWMVYQATVERHFLIFLVIAVFGSALTLASFIKVLYSAFLGTRPRRLDGVREVGVSMQIPMVVLAILCVIFGVFAQIPIRHFLGPVMNASMPGVPEAIDFRTAGAIWSPSLATLMILIGIAVGLMIYLVGHISMRREAPIFVGGEAVDTDVFRFSGDGFYGTVRSLGVLKQVYGDAEKGAYDVYRLGVQYGGSIVEALRYLHNGILSTYLSWCILGLGVLVLALAW